MTKLAPAYVATTALLLAAATGCSGSSNSASPSTAPTSSSSSSPSSTTPSTPSSPATASTTPPATPPATATTRTVKQLTAALIALADLPPGISIDDDKSGDTGPAPVASSKDSRCAKLVALTNADTPPGSKASASRSFSAGEQGPFIDESLDAMGSPAAVQALQQTLRKAIVSCRTLTLAIPGEGRSPIAVHEISAPKVGTNPVAVRYAATSGALDGLEITMVTTGVQDVLVSVTMVGGLPGDIAGATTIAVQKATKNLGSKAGA